MNKFNQLFEDILDVPIDEIDETVPFAETVDWDSLKHVQLVVGIQSTFQIELERDDIQRLQTVADVRNLFEERGVST